MIAINHQHVPVSTRSRPAFNGRIGGNRIQAVITFIVVIECDIHAGLRTRNNDIRNAKRATVVACTKIRMKRFGQSNIRNDCV